MFCVNQQSRLQTSVPARPGMLQPFQPEALGLQEKQRRLLSTPRKDTAGRAEAPLWGHLDEDKKRNICQTNGSPARLHKGPALYIPDIISR